MDIIKGKKILLIIPLYYGYDKEIKNELESKGASVFVVYENLDDAYMRYKIIYRYLKPLKKAATERYYKSRLAALKILFDYVFVIRGSSLSEDIIAMIKTKTTGNCRYIMYQWDSIQNNLPAMPYVKHFDVVYTFDDNDAKVFGWKYLPLFFVDHLANLNTARSIDLSLVCTMHTRRFTLYKKLKLISEQNQWIMYSHIYMRRIAFLMNRYFLRKSIVEEAKLSDMKFHSLSLKETYELYQKSKVIVDYTQPTQTGFTMRTIEALGNGCKLITNNPLIKNADFYDPNNVLVYEGTDVEIPDWFIQTPYNMLDESIYQKYTLTHWVEELFTQ